MHANNVRLQNWNGEIAGSLTSSNHINLYAHNGAVSLNATLLAGGYYHDGDSNIQTPTLIVTSVNGYAMSLLSAELVTEMTCHDTALSTQTSACSHNRRSRPRTYRHTRPYFTLTKHR